MLGYSLPSDPAVSEMGDASRQAEDETGQFHGAVLLGALIAGIIAYRHAPRALDFRSGR